MTVALKYGQDLSGSLQDRTNIRCILDIVITCTVKQLVNEADGRPAALFQVALEPLRFGRRNVGADPTEITVVVVAEVGLVVRVENDEVKTARIE